MNSRKCQFVASALLLAAASIFSPVPSHATLFPRDLDGNAATIEAYYDDVLNITWLANASQSETPNHLGIPMISTSGEMSWDTAQVWIAAVNALNGGAGLLGVNTWRLPSVSPVNGVSFDATLSFDGSTDASYQLSAPISANNPSGQSAGFTGSELAYHYYNNFGALGLCFGSGPVPTDCPVPSVAGFNNATNTTNLPLFRNVQGSILWAGPADRFYWTDTDLGPGSTSAWSFTSTSGLQGTNAKNAFGFVWLVVSGDLGGAVTPPPPPQPPVLLGRDLDGVPSTSEAYYDAVLDVTWLADSRLAASQTFGVPGILTSPQSRGSMDWATAHTWIAAMNAFDGGAGWLGVNTWRMPEVTPVNGVSFDTTLTYDGSTDVSDQLTAPIDANLNQSGQSPGSTNSELAYHYFNNLGGVGRCAGVGTERTFGCMLLPIIGTSNATHSGNVALFAGIREQVYWTGTESAPGGGQPSAFILGMNAGLQNIGHHGTGYVWAVASGDVGAPAVPLLSGWGHLLVGALLALAGLRYSRRTAPSS
jgi:hypothetical protein